MIEERLAAIEQDVGDLKRDVKGLDNRLSRVEVRLDGIDTRLDGIGTRLGGIDGRLDGLDSRLTKVEVTQESMRDDIKMLAEGHAATQAMMERGFADIKEHIDRRIDPLERALKAHLAAG